MKSVKILFGGMIIAALTACSSADKKCEESFAIIQQTNEWHELIVENIDDGKQVELQCLFAAIRGNHQLESCKSKFVIDNYSVTATKKDNSSGYQCVADVRNMDAYAALNNTVFGNYEFFFLFNSEEISKGIFEWVGELRAR